MPDLPFISATEALEAFRARSLSPVELLDAVIQRATETEPVINAFVETRYEIAYEQARQAEKRYAAGAGQTKTRPLDGLPLAVKGEEPVSGDRWTLGSRYLQDEVATYTAPWIERLEQAGAIVHARSALPEFAMSYFCHSNLDGVTRNPWNPNFTPGGSSGGSAAALAAGSTILATGSDVAGSIRVPSAFCGVVGYKPPYGRVPMWAPFNLDTYCHVGPMARSVADVMLMQNVAAGPHPADAATVRPKYILPTELDGVRGLRVAVSVDFGGSWPVDAEIRRNTLAAADLLRSLGAHVEEVNLVLDREEVKTASALHYAPFFDWVESISAAEPDQASPYLLAAAAIFKQRIAGRTAMEGLELEAKLSEVINRLLESFDVLICPTLGTRGFVAGDDYADHGLRVGEEQVDFYWDAAMTVPFNINSRCPVLNVPSGLCDNGVPSGLQIVGRTFDDVTVFRVGAALESSLPWPAGTPRWPSASSNPDN